jgi:hypothetical protein
MTQKHDLIEVDATACRTYVEARLEGSTLGRFVLQDRGSVSGHLTVYLPSPNVSRCDRGGVTDAGRSVGHITSLVRSFFNAHNAGLLVVEHPLASRRDSWLAEGRFEYRALDERVLLMATATTDEAKVQLTVRQLLRRGGVGIVADVELPDDRSEASIEWVRSLVRHAATVLIEAFDGESAIVWKL